MNQIIDQDICADANIMGCYGLFLMLFDILHIIEISDIFMNKYLLQNHSVYLCTLYYLDFYFIYYF